MPHKNKEDRNTARRARRKRDPKAARENDRKRSAALKAANPERQLTLNREKCGRWRHTHVEHRLWSEAGKRAKKKGIEFSLELADIRIPKVCPVLGIPITPNIGGKSATPNSPTLDRLDSSKGYTKENTRVISWRANKIKADATLAELEAIVRYMRGSHSRFSEK
jgi:hypothetical protein